MRGSHNNRTIAVLETVPTEQDKGHGLYDHVPDSLREAR
ncbi:hypothetical protein MA4S0303_2352 [Mycobacteroides abscessus 4S-0303]|jgi:hypothetical protein|nr:hypothetical protein MA4S0303_2352 [Mycobacteroides abscessus 4S-0303]